MNRHEWVSTAIFGLCFFVVTAVSHWARDHQFDGAQLLVTTMLAMLAFALILRFGSRRGQRRA
jgi:hypothetical protein